MGPLRHGDRILLDRDLDAYPGWVTYVGRWRARGFLAPCGAFYGLCELTESMERVVGVETRTGWQTWGYYYGFEQLLAEGLVDPAKSNRESERILEDRLADLLSDPEELHEFLGIEIPPRWL